jgi:hypothetical protein
MLHGLLCFKFAFATRQVSFEMYLDGKYALKALFFLTQLISKKVHIETVSYNDTK